MKTFSINTLGCKVNQYESQQIRQLLEALGLNQTRVTSGRCDLVVVNTCCVTHTASAKSRQYIHKAQKLNPDALIVVCGCLPTVDIGETVNPGKNVYLIRHRNNLADTLTQIVNDQAVVSKSQTVQSHPDNLIKAEKGLEIKCKKLASLPKFPCLTLFTGHTRAFLKVQDGCDGYCTYCIIPKTRPDVHSRDTDEILKEARSLVKAGHKEIVVTGIFLGAYGQGTVRKRKWPGGRNEKLAQLLEKLARIPDLARIRLSSLEPGDVSAELLDVFCRHRNIMPHLHLSLQSGSNAVLKRMCRQYRRDEFLQKIELIKARLDRPAITTDIIVGFPGETDEDFDRTVELARQVGFAKMHVFAFSARKGTAAADMRPVVSSEVIKERSRILRDLNIELAFKFRQRFAGEKTVVLTEGCHDGQIIGRTERYFMVYLKNNGFPLKKNELVKVQLVENRKDGMIGQLAEKGLAGAV